MLILAIGLLETCLVAVEQLDVNLYGLRECEGTHVVRLLCELFGLGDEADGLGGVLDAKHLGQEALDEYREFRVTVVRFVEGLDEILLSPAAVVADAVDISHQGGGEVIVVHVVVPPDIGVEVLGRPDGPEQVLPPDVVESLVGLRHIVHLPVARALQILFELMGILVESAVVARLIELTELAIHF